MRKLAKFEKVTYARFAPHGSESIYNDIRLPRRATAKSAGYDFFAPDDITLEPGQTITVATGIRALMPDDWCLLIYPRSGLGFKYKLRLNNTVGIIDADYADSERRAHFCANDQRKRQTTGHCQRHSVCARHIYALPAD